MDRQNTELAMLACASTRITRIRLFVNFLGLLAVAFGMFVLAWLFAVATPDQNSAECDALAEEMQGGVR